MTPRDVEAPGTVAAADRAHGTPSTNAAIVADAGCRDKGAATLIALAALAGFQLRKLADGRWLVQRWNLSRELADADAVRNFLSTAGVRP